VSLAWHERRYSVAPGDRLILLVVMQSAQITIQQTRANHRRMLCFSDPKRAPCVRYSLESHRRTRQKCISEFNAATDLTRISNRKSATAPEF
jgi:hypothetical protein